MLNKILNRVNMSWMNYKTQSDNLMQMKLFLPRFLDRVLLQAVAQDSMQVHLKTFRKKKKFTKMEKHT